MNAKHSPESTARLHSPIFKTGVTVTKFHGDQPGNAQVSLRSTLSVFESDCFQHVPVEKVCQRLPLGHLGPCGIVTLLLVLTCINSGFLFEKKLCDGYSQAVFLKMLI